MLGSDDQFLAAHLRANWPLGNGQDLAPINSLSSGPTYKQPALAAGSGGSVERALHSQGGQLPQAELCPPPGEL